MISGIQLPLATVGIGVDIAKANQYAHQGAICYIWIVAVRRRHIASAGICQRRNSTAGPGRPEPLVNIICERLNEISQAVGHHANRRISGVKLRHTIRPSHIPRPKPGQDRLYGCNILVGSAYRKIGVTGDECRRARIDGQCIGPSDVARLAAITTVGVHYVGHIINIVAGRIRPKAIGRIDRAL